MDRPPTGTDEPLSYGEFGRRFVALAVTPERIARTIGAVAGGQLDIGPLRAGPADAATVSGAGRIGSPVVEPIDGGEWLAFTATLPVELDLDVAVAGVHHRFSGELRVPLRLTVRTARPLRIVVDLEPPRAEEIQVRLRADGLRSKALRSAGKVDAQVRRHTARIVGARVRTEEAAAARVIDLLPLMDEAWDPSAPGGRPPAR